MADVKRNPLVLVVCAVIFRGSKFLAARRSAAQSNALLWEFPGGKVDQDEIETNALVRELQEELGIVVAAGKRLTPVLYKYPSFTIELIPYLCTIVSGTPHSHEHAEIRWIFPEEAQELEWAPADIPVLQEIVRDLN